MNPPKVSQYNYINFLIATQKAYSCSEAERVQSAEVKEVARRCSDETAAMSAASYANR